MELSAESEITKRNLAESKWNYAKNGADWA